MRTITALAEEVEFLRSQHFGTRATPPVQREIHAMPEFDFMPAHNPHFLTEEEEDVLALRDAGHLSHGEADLALAQLRAAVRGPIQIES